MYRRLCTLTVCVVDSGAMPSLLMVSLKVYSTSASSSEPEIPSTGPLEPRPKFKLEHCSGPCEPKLCRTGHHCRSGFFFNLLVGAVMDVVISDCADTTQLPSKEKDCVIKMLFIFLFKPTIIFYICRIVQVTLSALLQFWVPLSDDKSVAAFVVLLFTSGSALCFVFDACMLFTCECVIVTVERKSCSCGMLSLSWNSYTTL